eukprot:11059708-Heterocapsa_arctica.AAC.1
MRIDNSRASTMRFLSKGTNVPVSSLVASLMLGRRNTLHMVFGLTGGGKQSSESPVPTRVAGTSPCIHEDEEELPDFDAQDTHEHTEVPDLAAPSGASVEAAADIGDPDGAYGRPTPTAAALLEPEDLYSPTPTGAEEPMGVSGPSHLLPAEPTVEVSADTDGLDISLTYRVGA